MRNEGYQSGVEKSRRPLRQLGAAVMTAAFLNTTCAASDEGYYPYSSTDKVVVMGDSFAAGTGAGDYEPGTDTGENRCRRSKNAPGAIIAEEYRIESFSNIACRGASPNNLYEGQYGEPAQLEALDADADIVLLSLGGNVTNLDKLFAYCSKISCHPDSTIVFSTMDYIGSDQFQQILRQSYADIMQKAPHATIYVTLYPKIIQPRSYCPTLLSRNSDQFTSDFVDAVNQAITRAVIDTDSSRLVIVDPPENTDICASLGTGVVLKGADIGHPTKQTNKATSVQILKAMANHLEESQESS